MDQHIEETINLIKPSGLFSKSLQSNRKSNLLISLIVAIVFISRSLPVLVTTIYLSLQSKTIFDSSKFSFVNIWYKIYNMNTGISLLIIIYQRVKYINLIIDIDKILSKFLRISNEYSSNQRKYLGIFNFIMVTYEIVVASGHNGPIYIVNGIVNRDNKVSELVVDYFVHLLGAFSWLIFYNFMIESCIHLQSCFIVILYNIDQIDKKNSNIFRKIHIARLMYIEGIQITRHLDRYLSIFITSYYIHSIITCYLSFVGIFHDNSSILVQILFFSGQVFYLIFLTYNFVYVNCLSVKCYEKVYQLSICASTSQPVANEVRIF